jgi:hypothetical protein
VTPAGRVDRAGSRRIRHAIRDARCLPLRRPDGPGRTSRDAACI